MKNHSDFWPLDFEVEIYDNPSWNLPGRCKKGSGRKRTPIGSRRQRNSPPKELKANS
jgi:hypothetical protein